MTINMSTAPISLHIIVELSIALHYHNHTVTLVCHWSTCELSTQGNINWCHRDEDLKTAEPRGKITNKKQPRNRTQNRRNGI